MRNHDFANGWRAYALRQAATNMATAKHKEVEKAKLLRVMCEKRAEEEAAAVRALALVNPTRTLHAICVAARLL